MKISATHAKRKARIEIIPLIDIIFFLMATFMMVSLSMIKNEGVQVNLPTAASSTPQDRKDHVTVSITKDGEIFLEKQATPSEELKAQLSILKTKEPNLRVFIHGDENASLKHMMQVLDDVRLLGITKVAFQTKTTAPAASAPSE